MVFGIPGDSITAIVVGVLYLKGMNPGPTIMLRNPQLLYAVFITFFVANLMLVPLGWAAINLFRNILAVPREILMPLILLLCLVGSFAINNTVFDVGVMLLFGVIGYVMEENAFPVAPTILGIVLGPMIGQNFITSMMKANGSPAAFFERPIAGVLGGVTLIVWCRVVYAILRRGRSESETAVP